MKTKLFILLVLLIFSISGYCLQLTTNGYSDITHVLHLNENTGTKAHSTNGTLTGTSNELTAWVDGVYGSAIYCPADPTNGYFDINTADKLVRIGAFIPYTLGFWIYIPDTALDNYWITEWGNVTGNVYSMGVTLRANTQLKIECGNRTAGGIYTAEFLTSTLTRNKWYFLVITEDNFIIKGYVDGEFQNSDSYVNTITGYNTANWRVGGTMTWGGYSAGLSFDEVFVITGKELSPSEIKNMYNLSKNYRTTGGH